MLLLFFCERLHLFALVPIDTAICETLLNALANLSPRFFAARTTLAALRVVASNAVVQGIVSKRVVFSDELDLEINRRLSIFG